MNMYPSKNSGKTLMKLTHKMSQFVGNIILQKIQKISFSRMHLHEISAEAQNFRNAALST